MSQDIPSLIIKLEEIMGSAPMEWSEVYWLETDKGDCGEEYCKACADIKLNEYLDKSDDSEARVRGSISYESDGPCSCANCEAPLIHVLSDYGCKTEIESYVDYLESDQDPHKVTPEFAYALEMLLQYIQNNQAATAEDLAETTMQRLLFVNMVERLLDPSVPKISFSPNAQRTPRL